ncbi:hypothetical protein HZ326_28393 [Fusarium oxysporum f. sp. albedinis]|nr:hypothetical protein HZ326_28393 [Fusarium oxysporum f. sp. albedinis]
MTMPSFVFYPDSGEWSLRAPEREAARTVTSCSERSSEGQLCPRLRRSELCYVMYIFRPGGHWPRKVSCWSTGRAELNYLQLLSRWTPPRIPALSTRINGEPLELLPPRAPSYS